MTDKQKELRKAGLNAIESLSHFIPAPQRLLISTLIIMKTEEWKFFAEKMIELAKIIDEMPETYETEHIPLDDKIVHLHYFGGSFDAYVLEKDMGDGENPVAQIQAFGYQDTGYGAELGYISIEDICKTDGLEIDLYWEPRPVKDCQIKRIYGG